MLLHPDKINEAPYPPVGNAFGQVTWAFSRGPLFFASNVGIRTAQAIPRPRTYFPSEVVKET